MAWWMNTLLVYTTTKEGIRIYQLQDNFLVSNASKIILKIILDWMQQKLQTDIASEQAGFRPNIGQPEVGSQI